MTPEQLLDLSRRRCEAAEVFAVSSEDLPLAFEANRLKTAQARQTSGVALRVIKDGRIGFAASTRPDEAAEALVQLALETAPLGPEAKFGFPPTGTYPSVDLYDPAVEAVGLEHMAELGQQVIDRLRRHTPYLLCEGSVRRSVQAIHIINSAGADLTYRVSVFSLHMEATIIHGTDMLFVGDGDASCSLISDPSPIIAAIVQQLEWARDTVPAPSGQLPIILTPHGVAGTLVLPLMMAFSGRAVYQKASPLTDALGMQTYDARLSLIDDATIPLRPGSRPFDDEGVASRAVPLVADGLVSGFLYDLQTAGLAGAASTGSASRSLTAQPTIAASNLLVRQGETSLAEMVQNIKEGLLIEQLMGAGQGNVMGGEVSGNVLLGYRVQNGRVTGRVKDTMVAFNIHRALKQIGAIGSDARWVGGMGGSLHTPSISLAHVSVSTKG